jgi:translation initiation factor 3 subunit B
MISVYETPSMGLLEKKSLKLPGVQECAWSPANNYLAYWVPEKANGPASVAVLELPSRTVKREKHLFNVVDIKLHWHEQGDYLCVKVARKKTKKTITTNFEIFRVRQKDMPIETVELDVGVVAFAWEPHGHRFAIIQTGGEGTKNNVRIYTVKGKEVKLQKSFDNRPANALFWSPMGGHLVLAGLGPFNGQLEWIDCEHGESLTPIPQEHFQCSEVEWDPSGRFLITSATQPIGGGNWKYTMDNGYNLWSMQGQLLSQVKVDNCYQVMWRPRPSNLLSKEQIATLKQQLKEKYWNRFEKEDDAIRQSQLSGAAKERQELKSVWRAFRQLKEKEINEEKEMRRDLRNGQASDDEEDYVTVEREVEEEVGREEELWQNGQQ